MSSFDTSNGQQTTSEGFFLIPCLVESMKLHAGAGWVQLQVERRGLDGFLFVTGKPLETVGKRADDEKLHDQSILFNR